MALQMGGSRFTNFFGNNGTLEFARFPPFLCFVKGLDCFEMIIFGAVVEGEDPGTALASIEFGL